MIARSLQAVAAAYEAAATTEKPYVAVVLTDDDEATALGAYAARSTAQAQATRNGSDTLRSVVGCRSVTGGVVVMSGPYLMGTVEPT